MYIGIMIISHMRAEPPKPHPKEIKKSGTKKRFNNIETIRRHQENLKNSFQPILMLNISG